MKNHTNAKMLRVFIDENDKYETQLLYEKIVFEAHEQGLAGATVIKGIMGFGPNSKKIHSTKLFEISSDLPMIIEIVDTDEKIKKFIASLEHVFEKTNSEVFIVIEKVEFIRYRKSE